ncbi:MAG: hypothetical protein JNL01_00780 [Bdellovibrionales bacterium]|nr:hypothetical protein [Bdellovibrionales bacterium]
MSVSTRALQSFLVDSFKLLAQAYEILTATEKAWADGVAVDPEEIRKFFHRVHTLKGTSTMIPGGDFIVSALTTLEDQVFSRPFAEVAADWSWIPFAKKRLELSKRALIALKERMVTTPTPMVPQDYGIVAKVVLSDESFLVWFPNSSLTRVISPEEIQGQEKLCLSGEWVPVLGRSSSPETFRIPFGLGVRFEGRQLVLAVQEFVQLTGWREASQVGAREGISFLMHYANRNQKQPSEAA